MTQQKDSRIMTPREQTAFNAGVEAVCQMALVAAIRSEARDDDWKIRQQVS